MKGGKINTEEHNNLEKKIIELTELTNKLVKEKKNLEVTSNYLQVFIK